MIGGAAGVRGQGGAFGAVTERSDAEELPLDLEFYVADLGEGLPAELRDLAAPDPRGQESEPPPNNPNNPQGQPSPGQASAMNRSEARTRDVETASALDGIGAADPDAVVQAVDEESEADDARQEPDLPTHAEPEDFWQNVVQLHQQFVQDPQAHPRALDSAILWAAMAASTTALPTSGVGVRPGSPGVTSGGQSPARPSLSDQAVDALVVAWQQRDSALAAVGRGKG